MQKQTEKSHYSFNIHSLSLFPPLSSGYGLYVVIFIINNVASSAFYFFGREKNYYRSWRQKLYDLYVKDNNNNKKRSKIVPTAVFSL